MDSANDDTINELIDQSLVQAIKQEVPDTTPPLVDSTNIDRYFMLYLRASQTVLPQFEIDGENREVFTDLFYWAIKDYSGRYDPDKGLFIWGDIGTGKTTLLELVRLFTRYVRRPVDSELWTFPLFPATEVSASYSKRGVAGLDEYLAYTRVGFDDLGLEPRPSRYYGDTLNVFERVLQQRSRFGSDGAWFATTNMRPEQIRDFYGDQTYDRCREMVNNVELTGYSRRSSSTSPKSTLVSRLPAFFDDSLTRWATARLYLPP